MIIHRKRDLTIIAIVAAATGILPLVIGDFYLYLIRLISIYVILALGLNIFMGYCGQINFGIAGFFCMGGYGAVLLQLNLEWHFFAALVTAVLLCLFLSWLISWPLLRLKGHSMAIGTLAFAMVIFLIAERFPSLTGGGDGLVVPSTVLFGRTMGELFFYYLILGFVTAAYLICYFLVGSRIGRALKGVRDNEEAAAAMGVDVQHYKRMAWVLNSVFAGVAGALHAQQTNFICPDTFSLWTNVLVLVMICVGGLSRNLGSVVGAAIMTSLPFFLTKIQDANLLVQGLILFAVLRFLPDGVVGAMVKSLRKAT